MTIESAKNLIIPLLLDNDVITIRDIEAATIKREISDHDNEIFLLALEDLDEKGLIKKLKNEDAWVLVRPLVSLNQNVEIDGECAVTIAETINAIIEKFSFDKMTEATPFNITQADIEKLLLFLSEIKIK